MVEVMVQSSIEDMRQISLLSMLTTRLKDHIDS